MWRALVFIGLLCVAAFGAVWLADRPGGVLITWGGYRIETTVAVVQEPPGSRQRKQMLVGVPVAVGMQKPLQHSLSAVQEIGLAESEFGVQHLPFSQIVPLQHCVSGVQEPQFDTHAGPHPPAPRRSTSPRTKQAMGPGPRP